MSLALARKFRPKNFHQLVGQKHVSQALIYALDKADIHHAYLFTGTRGVGKTTIARIFAKSLNCEKGITSQPCGECSACREIDNGSFPDLIEIDAASRSQVESTRQFLSDVPYKPVKGRFKVYLIDEVHMFSDGSFNALLKTLEEPPEHVKFILATTDPQKIPQTVISRCLQFQLKNMTESQISGHLSKILQEEGLKFEAEALDFIAEAAQGSMRDALSILDQAKSYGRGEITTETCAELLGAVPALAITNIFCALTNNDAVALRTEFKNLEEFSPDYSDFLRKIIKTLQQITIAQLNAQRTSNEVSAELVQIANALPKELVQIWYEIAQDSWQSIAFQPDSSLAMEMTLLRMLAFRPEFNLESNRKIPEVSPEKKVEIKANVAEKIVKADEQSVENPPIKQLEDAKTELENLTKLEDELNLENSPDEDTPPFDLEEVKKKITPLEAEQNLGEFIKKVIANQNVELWFELINSLPHKGNQEIQEILATDTFPLTYDAKSLCLAFNTYAEMKLKNTSALEDFLTSFLGKEIKISHKFQEGILCYAEFLEKKEEERKKQLVYSFSNNEISKLLRNLGLTVKSVHKIKE